MSISIPSHGEMIIRRPNGAIETVRAPILSSAQVAKATADTRKAGRGEILSYTIINRDVAEPTPTAAEIASDVHHAQRRAIERASASGERNEAITRRDNTPMHKGD
jgi:hypothetical protein